MKQAILSYQGLDYSQFQTAWIFAHCQAFAIAIATDSRYEYHNLRDDDGQKIGWVFYMPTQPQADRLVEFFEGIVAAKRDL